MNTLQKIKDLMTGKGGIYVNLTNGKDIIKGWVPYSCVYGTRFMVTGLKNIYIDGKGGNIRFNVNGKMLKNNRLKNNWSIVFEEEKPKTLAECRENYVLVNDKNGVTQRVKRGKEFIQFMIKNS